MKKTNSLQVSALALGCLLLSAITSPAFYNASTGRWLSRDPIGERGGPDVYALQMNSSQGVEFLGLCCRVTSFRIVKAEWIGEWPYKDGYPVN